MSNRITRGIALVGRIALPNNVFFMEGAGGPLSGTSGTGVNRTGPGSLYINRSNGVVYTNEGTKASPYWTPRSFDQPGLLGVYDDFRGPDAKPLASATAFLNAASGMRVFGGGGATTKGVVNTDSGVTKGTDVAGAHVGLMATTNEDETVVALGMGSAVAQMSPSVNGPLVIDITWAQLTNILTRRLFVGFAGEAADGMIPLFTSATTVITFAAAGSEGDDMAGIVMDDNLTDSDGLFLAHAKADAAATIATSATGVDLSTALAAAATYQRFRLEVSAAGAITAFIDKVQVSSISGALTAATALLPVAALMVESGTTILSATVKQFMCWGSRS